MTLRERIADWISGGALSQAQDASRIWNGESNDGWTKDIFRAVALREIAAMETPYANATVRRMAATAREALK